MVNVFISSLKVTLDHTYHHQAFVKKVINCKSQNIAQYVLLDGYNLYSIQQYVIKFVSDFRSVVSLGTPVSSNKTDRHDMTEILLKVALNTINLTLALQDILMLFIYLDFFREKILNIALSLRCLHQPWT